MTGSFLAVLPFRRSAVRAPSPAAVLRSAAAVLAAALAASAAPAAAESWWKQPCSQVAVELKLRKPGEMRPRIDDLAAVRHIFSVANAYGDSLNSQFGSDYVESIRAGLIKSLLLAGRFVEAESVATEALDASLLQFGNEAETTVFARAFLSQALFYQNRFYEAELVLQPLEGFDVGKLKPDSYAAAALALMRGRLAAIRGDRERAIAYYGSASSFDYMDLAFLAELMRASSPGRPMATFLRDHERGLFPSQGGHQLAKWCLVIAVNMAGSGERRRARGILEAGTAIFEDPGDSAHWLMIASNASLADIYRSDRELVAAYRRISDAGAGLWSNFRNEAVTANSEDARRYLVDHRRIFLESIELGWAVTHSEAGARLAGKRKRAD
jgi:hypothetical protein